ncbi:unnamed protein product [Choristocarpus tenellus]
MIVNGICSCPVYCINCGKPGDNFNEYGRGPCLDWEASEECDRANWEVADMIASLGTLVTESLDRFVSQGDMTVPQMGFVRTLVSRAIEDEKPEGDCADGLATETLAKGTLHHCYSPDLLEQCAMVRDAVDDYQQAIAEKLRGFILSEEDMYDEYNEVSVFNQAVLLGVAHVNGTLATPVEELVEVVRFRGSVTTANIRCASYESTIEDLSIGSRFVPGLLIASISILVGVAGVSILTNDFI